MSLLRNLQLLFITLKRKPKLHAKASEVLWNQAPSCLLLAGSPPPPCTHLAPPIFLTCQAHTYLFRASAPSKGSCTLFWDRLGKVAGKSIHRNMSPPWNTTVLLIRETILEQILKLGCWFSPLPLGHTGKHSEQNIFFLNLGQWNYTLTASLSTLTNLSFYNFVFFFWCKLYLEILDIHTENCMDPIYRTRWVFSEGHTLVTSSQIKKWSILALLKLHPDPCQLTLHQGNYSAVLQQHGLSAPVLYIQNNTVCTISSLAPFTQHYCITFTIRKKKGYSLSLKGTVIKYRELGLIACRLILHCASVFLHQQASLPGVTSWILSS